jgi:integrase
MKKLLTDFAVIQAKPKATGYEVSDSGQRGLRLAVRPSGVKSWVVRYRHPVTGISRKLTLQSGLGLAEARRLASEAMYQVAKGVDPIDAKRAEKQARLDAAEGTLNAVAKLYIDLAASKLRSREYYEITLRNHILPKLGERPIADIRRTDITAVLDRVEQTAGPSAADAAKRVLSALMNWHQGRSDFVSPMTRMKSRLKPSERARKHVPSDDETRRIWNAAGNERIGHFGQVIRFMVMTGARKSEASGLRRCEIETLRDNGAEITVWRLPASRSKNKAEVVRPLSKSAIQIIDDMPTIGEDSDFVFTFDGRRPMSMNYMDKKRLLDQLSGVTGWRLHDLRRVHRSLLSRCRVPFDIAERCLGHSRGLLVATYDQHSHLPAMQEAVDKVAAEVERIISGGGKVIRLVN